MPRPMQFKPLSVGARTRAQRSVPIIASPIAASQSPHHHRRVCYRCAAARRCAGAAHGLAAELRQGGEALRPLPLILLGYFRLSSLYLLLFSLIVSEVGKKEREERAGQAFDFAVYFISFPETGSTPYRPPPDKGGRLGNWSLIRLPNMGPISQI
jgi:hypothetical protein